MAFIEKITGNLEDKRRWRANKARVEALPAPYRDSVKALQRYIWRFGGIVDGQTMVVMLDDLADLFERAAADDTPIRAVVGDDPVEFAETFTQAYAGKHWIDKERQRLVDAINQAAS